MHALTLTIFLLATGLSLRLVRLFCDDTITAPLRDAVMRKVWADGKVDAETLEPRAHPGWKFLSDVLDCPWCLGVWVAAAVFGAAYVWGDTNVFVWGAAAASASYLVGLVSMWQYSLVDD